MIEPIITMAFNNSSIKLLSLQVSDKTSKDANSVLHQLGIVISNHHGKCLSADFVNLKQKLLWECENGHKWRASLNSVLYSGSWCPQCAGNRKLSLIEMQRIACRKGGRCLSSKYVNSKVKLLWQCKNGHQWYANALSIKDRNSWCPYCAGNQPLGMATVHKLAQGNDGVCISTKYTNCKIKMLWRCKNGHQFLSSVESVKLGRWCPYCNHESSTGTK